MKEDLKGLGVLKERIVKCGDCGKSLAEIIVVGETDVGYLVDESRVPVKYRINCNKCGGSSFETPKDGFQGETALGAIKDGEIPVIEDVDQKEKYILVHASILGR